MVENQVIVITGAARGIGFEIGKRFAENGEKLCYPTLIKLL